MRVFDDEDGVKRSIAFFNTLPDLDKVTIVTDLRPVALKPVRHYGHLDPLLSEVQVAISKFDDIVIGNRLVDLGLEDTYARLFVSNIKKHAQTEEHQLRQMSMMPDDVFAKSVAGIIKSAWVHDASEDDLAEKFSVTKEQLRCIVGVARIALNALARGDMTKESMRERYSDKLSPAKFESLSNTLLASQKHWCDSLLFSNAQDSRHSIAHVAKQNEAIIKLLHGVLDTLLSNAPRGKSRAG